MAVDERRRIALHRQASASWGEEAADTLLELGAPAGRELATRADLQHLSERIDARFDASEERMNSRFSQLGALVVIAALAFGLR
jgi:hypothetical protein